MCDTMVTIGDDGVMFAKNSDRDAVECQMVEWHEAASSLDGLVECTWTSIDQVGRTNAVLLSRPWWMWGAEIGANEHGVVIGNQAVFTDQPYADEGLLGMDLLRLALERAASADDAVQTIVTLLERHGQGGACSRVRPDFTYHNSFIVADPQGAIVLETAGRFWATEVVAAGSARSISNGLTIGGFAEAHADVRRGRLNGCALRRSITESGAGGADGPLALMTTLRSHGASEHPTYSPINGGINVPCVHGGGLHRGTASTSAWVADLRAAPLHWVTATAAPCTSIFKPVRVNEPVDLGPTGTDEFDESVLWWRHEQLSQLVDRDPARLLPRFAPERDAAEAAWVADPPSGSDAFGAADRMERRWLADARSVAVADRRPPLVRAAAAQLDDLLP